jgi:hypothetical protein
MLKLSPRLITNYGNKTLTPTIELNILIYKSTENSQGMLSTIVELAHHACSKENVPGSAIPHIPRLIAEIKLLALHFFSNYVLHLNLPQ